MKMTDCPKFDSCNAPVCPLHDEHTTHLSGEPICFYLREYVKNGGIDRLWMYMPREMVELIADRLPEITSRHVDIKNRLERAAKSGSKMETFKNLRRVDV